MARACYQRGLLGARARVVRGLLRVAGVTALLRTGVPNSGKSEWIDALLMNLTEQYGWSFALCSLEKTPDKHAIQVGHKGHTAPGAACTCACAQSCCSHMSMGTRAPLMPVYHTPAAAMYRQC